MTRLVLAPTALVADDLLVGARALMDLAFDDLEDDDWEHALGGVHALVVDDDRVLAHGSLVLRRLLHRGQALRCGYVEAVATHPDHRRRGLATRVMDALEGLGPGYDLLALGTTDEGFAFYTGRGWVPWRGPTSVLAPDGLRRTPDDDGAVLVLGAAGLDLDGGLVCDWRDGDVW